MRVEVVACVCEAERTRRVGGEFEQRVGRCLVEKCWIWLLGKGFGIGFVDWNELRSPR